MTASVLVADVAAYLEHTGWRRTDSWRGAGIWARDGAEVLLPARDDLGDTPTRMRELLRALAAAESRPAREVERDITFPFVDSATYRLHPDERPGGFTSLPAGLQAMTGLRDMVAAAARVVLEGPHSRFSGKADRAVGEFLGRTQVGSGAPDTVTLTLLVPFTGSSDGEERQLTGRDVMTHLHDATAAVGEAVAAQESSAFDETVTAGVSADFCTALSDLAGRRRREPFDVGFRWSRSAPPELPPRIVSFPPEAGVAIRSAATRLRRLDVSGAALVIGRIEGLYDGSGDRDRRRVLVRGELRTDRGTGSRRTVWVRLADRAAYDTAIEAHRAAQPVRAEGVLTSRAGRVELAASPGGFAVAEPSPNT